MVYMQLKGGDYNISILGLPKTCIIMFSQAYYQFIGHLKTCMKLKYCHDAIAIMKCKDNEHRKSVCPVCG
jgi:hypothetical protein